MRFKARFISRENSNQDPNILALIGKEGILNLSEDDFAYFVVTSDKYQNFRTSMLKCDPMLHDNRLTFQTMNSSYVFEVMEIVTFGQALAEIAGTKEELLHIHLYECGHVWQKVDGQAPEDCPVCQREAEAAAYRSSLIHFLCVLAHETSFIEVVYKDNVSLTSHLNKVTEAASELTKIVTSSTAGRDLLERMKQLEKMNDVMKRYIARCSVCPLDNGKCFLEADDKPITEERCQKAVDDYFLHKAGVSTP